MEPMFRLSYSEHEVAGRLQSLLGKPRDAYSVTLPLSRHNKGWDLLVHSSKSGQAARIQVKSSRWYFEPKREERGFSHVFWFNNFRAKLEGADFFVLFIVFPVLDRRAWSGRHEKDHWVQRTIILSRGEVSSFLPPETEDFFYMAFDEDRPDDLIFLNGSKTVELWHCDYRAFRSSVRVSILRDFLSRERETRRDDVVRPVTDAA